MKQELINKILSNIKIIEGPLITPCWVWQGNINTEGYGRIGYQGNYFRVHVVMCEALHGPLGIAEGACHECDNTACCNPNHLFPGTQAANVQDAISKGRFRNAPQGGLNGRAIIKEGDIPVIKRRKAAGETTRQIANDYGVVWVTIHNIIIGKSWSHIT